MMQIKGMSGEMDRKGDNNYFYSFLPGHNKQKAVGEEVEEEGRRKEEGREEGRRKGFTDIIFF